MENPFKRDEDGDLCCAVCGAQVRQMVIKTEANIGIEYMDDNDFDCCDWDYTDTKLDCVCGTVISQEAYEWLYEDFWVLRLNEEFISDGQKRHIG